MKGILGCDADWLKPGERVRAANGQQMTILRKVTLEEALASAERNNLPKPEPVGNEHWYEVDVDLRAGSTNN